VRGSLLQACWIVFWHSLSIVGCGVIVQKWKGGQLFNKPFFFWITTLCSACSLWLQETPSHFYTILFVFTWTLTGALLS
jgi:hypothetical protein